MRLKHLILQFIVLTLLFGCAGKKPIDTAPDFVEKRPTVIAVMPAFNETVDLDAAKPFLAEVTRAVIARGYQVVPHELIKKMMEKEGIQVAGQLGVLSDKELGQTFGAQALLFTTVTSWDTVYLGVYASVSVGARFELVEASTSKVLWKKEEEVKERNFAIDKDSAAETAAFAAFQQYGPLVTILVNKSFNSLPGGPFGGTKLNTRKRKKTFIKKKYK